MDKEAIKQWIEVNLVMQDKAMEITEQSVTGFNQSVTSGAIVAFVEFGKARKTRLYLRSDLETYLKNKRIRKSKGAKNMSNFENLNVTNSTIIDWEGKELRTLQDPTVSDDGTTYTAIAVDDQESQYRITWEVINFETTDESEACDWDHPIEVKSI